MNLQEIKNNHAKSLGFTDFEEMFSEALHTGIDYCVDAIAIKYARYKLEEAAQGQTPQMCVELTKNSIRSFKDDLPF